MFRRRHEQSGKPTRTNVERLFAAASEQRAASNLESRQRLSRKGSIKGKSATSRMSASVTQCGRMIFDHIDLRVIDVTAVRPFYDIFLKAFGFRGQRQANGDVVYYRVSERRVKEAIAIIESVGHVPNEARLAFHADSTEDVDRIAGLARGAGARDFEAPQWCPEIADRYYAAFFEDPSGNRLEVVYR